MGAAYLAVARGQSEQPAEPTELNNLLHELADDVRSSGIERQFETAQPVTLMLRRLSFKRALSNLIENALRFGRHVRLTMERRRDSVELHIDDDGPGIPEKDRKSTRLNSSH